MKMHKQPNENRCARQGRVVIAVACLGAVVSVSGADTRLLNAQGDTETVNGGKFTLGVDRPSSGTGVFDPFLTLDDSRGNKNNIEDGYNTSARPLNYPDANDPLTSNLQLKELRKDTPTGTRPNAFIFDLDLNEPDGGLKPYLGLTDLKIWVNPVGSLNFASLGDFGTPVWDLDVLGDTTLIFNDLGRGSGSSDVEFQLPAEALQNVVGVTQDYYLYFYCRFAFVRTAEDGTPEGGFEEWAVDVKNLAPSEPDDFSVQPVPEPKEYAMLAGLGLIAFAAMRRFKR